MDLSTVSDLRKNPARTLSISRHREPLKKPLNISAPCQTVSATMYCPFTSALTHVYSDEPSLSLSRGICCNHYARWRDDRVRPGHHFDTRRSARAQLWARLNSTRHRTANRFDAW